VADGRDVVRGILLLIFAAIVYWVNFTVGAVVVALMGLMILQSAFSGWCLADVFLRPMGLKSKLESADVR